MYKFVVLTFVEVEKVQLKICSSKFSREGWNQIRKTENQVIYVGQNVFFYSGKFILRPRPVVLLIFFDAKKCKLKL